MSEKTAEQIAAEAKAAEDANAATAAKAVKSVKVRVTADQAPHKVNDVATLPADEAKAAVAAGWADDHPAAVKYAEGLAKAAAPAAE